MNYSELAGQDYGIWNAKKKRKRVKADEGTDVPTDKKNGKKNGPRNPKTVAALSTAVSAVGQFTESRRSDYSNLNTSSRGNVVETDLTKEGHSDYFARDNIWPV